ncbi:cell growth-regulating nucleolar protein [Coccidioides immitis RS]|uniref:Cell growth-regulating nucleolar protein n=3 Tax=Coccidioides immitis TaxID=5501 RepID=A0A0D8JT36_COCIM|nr:cell growth-regulating nucleolar protein [Coccidioides immitis RS]KJF60457.1 cell growth-regulating nucleolar protein [Coccidioides immitis RS]KMP02841.1 hypothetical protein CIRG_02534 [Coccidioides immitis RMSCC 2394]TPX23294.1 hypothetical protein DIZ76_012621 [Coccidioides immitis]
MVSFQCEACGDVFTKKKLDPHRGQCRGATFSCLDCMVHFKGTEYRSHTSCMSEAQKYQGALYKEKPAKGQKRKKTVTIADTVAAKGSRNPYVEDAPDVDDIRPPQNEAPPPPPAPSPPPATASLPPAASSKKEEKKDESLNVFEFLVPEDGRNASKVSLGGTKEQMKMVKDAPKLFDVPKELARLTDGREDDESVYDVAYEENGFSYGAGPIPPAPYNQPSNISMEFLTPVPGYKSKGRSKKDYPPSLELNRTNSDKKRKRTNPEHMVTPANQTKFEDDISMEDAPSSMVVNAPTPALNHSGLTGGLSRMTTRYSQSPDSPDYRSDREYLNGDRYPHPVSPIKRTRRATRDPNDENGLGISVKGRSAIVRTRRRSTPDGEKEQVIHVRKQKRHRVRQPETVKTSKSKHRTNDIPAANDEGEWDDFEDERPRRLKAIEYKRQTDSEDRSRSPRQGSTSKPKEDNQIVIYNHGKDESEDLDLLKREKANVFLSLVNKGPESERGCSIHKILKRFHRDKSASLGSEEQESKEGGERGRGRGRRRNRGLDKEKKDEEEQDLWRMLRLKKNDRGEVVVFLQPNT